MKPQAYPSYKTSKVEWLGDVPDHWRVKAIKWETPVLRGASPRPIDDPSYFDDDDGEYSWVRISDVTSAGAYLNITEQKLSRLGSSLSVKLNPGALFLSIAGSVGKPCITKIKCCIHDGFVYFPRFKGDVKFLYYLFASGEPYRGLGKLGTQLNLNTDTVGSIVAGFPPPHEQQAIATFLDQETGRIDQLVQKKKELIERLKEKRTALISRTVTRGLSPEAARTASLPENPALKDSGIEWLGEIPERWEVRRLKDVGTLRGGAGFPHEEQGLEDEELPFYKVGDLKASLDGRVMTKPEHTISKVTARKLRASVIPPESIIYAKIGAALLLNRRRVTSADCCIDNNMTAYLPDKQRVSCEWALYWLSILDFGEFMNPGAVPSFSEGYQAILPILFPSLSEQAVISSYLDTETAKLDKLVAKVEEAIERLQEYRTALITAAVTGKIDVRESLAA